MVAQRGHESSSDGNAAVRVVFHRSQRHLLPLRRAAGTLRPRESPEPPAHQVQIGQRTGDQQPVCVLRQALIASLHETEDALDDEQGMLDLGAHAGLGNKRQEARTLMYDRIAAQLPDPTVGAPALDRTPASDVDVISSF
jgi:hypothetical protein